MISDMQIVSGNICNVVNNKEKANWTQFQLSGKLLLQTMRQYKIKQSAMDCMRKNEAPGDPVGQETLSAEWIVPVFSLVSKQVGP